MGRGIWFGRLSMEFEGLVEFRSSARPRTGPPGESEIQARNPERVRRILEITGWQRLASGSLNVAVADSVVAALENHVPSLVEDASGISYPAPYEYIPKIRRAYWYYSAKVLDGDQPVEVLVRRAQIPVPGRVELFSAEPLVQRLGLQAGTSLRVRIDR